MPIREGDSTGTACGLSLAGSLHQAPVALTRNDLESENQTTEL